MKYKIDNYEQLKLKMLGNKIAFERNKKGFSRHGFAKEVNLSHNMLCKIEWGITNPSYVTLLRICDKLEIKMKDLLKEE